MAVIKCKMCGGDLNLIEGSYIAECEFCGTKQTVPSADNDKKVVLYGRANRLRINCEFDKAAGVYEAIVADFPEEAEAYWGLILCKYGIEYVDDPLTGRKVPTCHRSNYDSVFNENDFELVLENADSVAKKLYREEAKVIEELRKEIIEISFQEEPYDVFICYKETDENGERTVDSVLAQDIYLALEEKGYRVFFSRITLEDKIGQEYEPYIFAALNSAKVMLVIGTDYEYFNAVWVRNEWSRFLKMMEKDKTKYLIPCFKGIDAYDIPKEFNKLQAQDLGKVGAVQDLLHGIDKLLNTEKSGKRVVKEIAAEDFNKSYVYNNALEMAISKKPKEVQKAIDKLETIRDFWDTNQKIEELKAKKKKLIRKRGLKRLIIFILIVSAIIGAYYGVKYIVYSESYEYADRLQNQYEYGQAMQEFLTIEGFKDSEERAQKLQQMMQDKEEACLKLMKATDPELRYETNFLIAEENVEIDINAYKQKSTFAGHYSWTEFTMYYSTFYSGGTATQEKRVEEFFEPKEFDIGSYSIEFDKTTNEYIGVIGVRDENGFADGIAEIFRGKLQSDGSLVLYNEKGVTYTLIPQEYSVREQ